MADKGDLAKDVDGVVVSLSKMDRIIEKLTGSVGKFTSSFKDGFKSTGLSNNGGTGQTGIGSSGRSQMPTSFGNIGSFLSMNRGMNLAGAIGGGLIKGVTGLAAGAMTAMPDVALTTARSSAYYDAARMAGLGPNGRNRLAQATFGSMKGGISEAGFDAVTAGILTRQGVQYGATGVNAGQFGNLATATANAAKYLNMDNATAAQAVSGFTKGGTSSSLMRNFGIYTTDPTTGRRFKPTEIFEQLNERVTGGQKLSRQDLMTSMQGGSLESILGNSGMSEAQQQMAYEFMLNKADGKTMALEDEEKMNTLFKAAGTNPNQSQYDLATAQTGTMQKASDAYIDGIKKATDALVGFHKMLDGFLDTKAGNFAAQMNAGFSTFMSDPMGQGAATAAAGLGGGILEIGAGIAQTAMLGKMMKGIGGGAGTTGGLGGAAGTTAGKPAGAKWKPGGKGGGGSWVNEKTGKPLTPKQLAAARAKGGGGAPGGKPGYKGGFKGRMKGGLKGGAIMAGVGLLMDAGANNEAAAQGYGGSAWGESIGTAVGSVAGAAIGQALIPIPVVGGLIGGFVGGWLGGMAGQAIGSNFDTASGGTDSTVGTGTASDTSGGIKLVHPVPKGSRVTTKFGQKDKLHSQGHKGVDWGVSEGTPIQAAADGTVTYSGGSSTNTMGTSNRSLGIQIHITHANGYKTVYGHLSSAGVAVGTQVTAGQMIGRSGNTGYSTGPHLHFELHKNGTPIDPSSALGGNYSSMTGEYSESVGTGDVARNSSGGQAPMLGYSIGAKDAAGIKAPAPYTGTNNSGRGVIAVAGSKSVASGSLGHGASTTSTGGAAGAGGAEAVRGGNHIEINVTVAQASESEARRFAQMVKQYLDDDMLTANMGRM